MVASTFTKILPYIWTHEGGFTREPASVGGSSNMGVTRNTLAHWRGRRTTHDDVKRLGKTEAEKIYKVMYWDKIYGDDLPVGVDYSTFDLGVNAGPRRAIKTLQKAVGSNPDGVIGPVTLDAIRRMDNSRIITRYFEYRVAFYKRLKTFRKYGPGWLRRAREVFKISMNLIKGVAT